MPGYVMEGGPFRPDLLLWIELPEGLIVWGEAVDPRERVAFGDSLGKAMKSPQAGAPRRPGRVRVADAALARELRDAFPELDVVVAETPELDEVMREMARSMPGDPPTSYLEEGRIPEEAVAALFGAAKVLWEMAPWKVADDDQVLCVDVPALGIERACLAIIGALGESFGFLLFPSIEGYLAFGEVADSRAQGDDGPLDLGTTVLSLDFERAADLPSELRDEVERHGWPVAAPEAYPRAAARDRDGVPRPIELRELRALTMVATVLPAFVAQYREAFVDEDPEPVSISYFNSDEVEVRFTIPYDAHELFAASAAPKRSAPRAGRNDPCPCGSGRKYKKCCLEKDGAAGS